MARTDQMKNLDTVENTKSQEQLKAKNDILQSVKQFTDNLQDKEKAATINQLAPKVLNAMQSEWIDMKDIRDSKNNWKNILLLVLSQLRMKSLNRYNSALTPWNKMYNKWVWKFKSLLKRKNYNADIKIVIDNKETAVKKIDNKTNKVDKTIETKKSRVLELKIQIDKAKQSKKSAQEKYNLQLEDPKNLETPKQQKAIAKKLWYTDKQIKDIKTKYEKSSYKNAGLSIGQVFSFLQTKQQLKNKNVQEDKFFKDFWPIQRDLKLPEPSKPQMPIHPDPIKAEDLQPQPHPIRPNHRKHQMNGIYNW